MTSAAPPPAAAAPASQPEAAVRVLAAVADAVLGADHDRDVPARILDLLGRLPSKSDRDQLRLMLRLLASRAGALLLTGKATPLPERPAPQVEALLQGWLASRMALRRRLASVFVGAALNAHYAVPSPAWERIGYPGPLGPAPDVPRRLEPLELDRDEALTCDVVVVGSGAGGSVVAAELARAGVDVVVLEKGGYAAEADFHHREWEATRDLYLYGLTLATTDLGCRIIAGSTLGGGPVVNYTTSFKTPGPVLAEWARESGSDLFTSGELEASLDVVARRMGVTTEQSKPGTRDQLMEEGLRKLGWHVEALPRGVRGCAQDDGCGWCGFGCRLGAKQGPTWLEDAASSGARLVIRADTRRVLIEEGRATGVAAVTPDGHRLTVRAKAVVAAGGAIETPALLLRSGLGGQVGHHLRLHPGTAAIGFFDQDVKAWTGTLQARYSAELRGTFGEYAPLFETVPVHPGNGAAALPWLSAADHRALMDRYGRLSLCGVLCRDTTAGRVTIGRDGNPRVAYQLTASDEQRIAAAVAAAGQVLAAAGASEVMSLHPQKLSFRTDGGEAAWKAWAEATRNAGYRNGRVTFFSYHQMGSCRLGADPARSAVNPDHETHEVKHLYVADSSLFPTASGVNPMLSVMGLAHRAAGRIAAHLD